MATAENTVFTKCLVESQRGLNPLELADLVIDTTTDEDRERFRLQRGDKHIYIACSAESCAVKGLLRVTQNGSVATSQTNEPQLCVWGIGEQVSKLNFIS